MNGDGLVDILPYMNGGGGSLDEVPLLFLNGGEGVFETFDVSDIAPDLSFLFGTSYVPVLDDNGFRMLSFGSNGQGEINFNEVALTDDLPTLTPRLFTTGTGRRDRLNGGEGQDTLNGAGGNDTLRGADGHDRLDGGTGRDRVFGGDGNDRLVGGGQADLLYGENGRDMIFGQGGNDRLDGGRGNDVLVGGGGADVFVFSSGHDVVRDFGGNDVLDLSSARGIRGYWDLTHQHMSETDDGIVIEAAAWQQHHAPRPLFGGSVAGRLPVLTPVRGRTGRLMPERFGLECPAPPAWAPAAKSGTPPHGRGGCVQ